MCGLVLPVKSPWPFWLLHELSGESICFFLRRRKNSGSFSMVFPWFHLFVDQMSSAKMGFLMVFSCFGGPASSVQFVQIWVVDSSNYPRRYHRSNEKKSVFWLFRVYIRSIYIYIGDSTTSLYGDYILIHLSCFPITQFCSIKTVGTRTFSQLWARHRDMVHWGYWDSDGELKDYQFDKNMMKRIIQL